MTTKDEALKMALDALEYSKSYLDELADVLGTSKKAKPGSTSWHVDRAITACRAALEQKDEAVVTTTTTIEALEQEIYENTRLFVPTAVMQWMLSKYHTAPPKRPPLTDDEICEALGIDGPDDWTYTVARAVEAKLNGGRS